MIGRALIPAALAVMAATVTYSTASAGGGGYGYYLPPPGAVLPPVVYALPAGCGGVFYGGFFYEVGPAYRVEQGPVYYPPVPTGVEPFFEYGYPHAYPYVGRHYGFYRHDYFRYYRGYRDYHRPRHVWFDYGIRGRHPGAPYSRDLRPPHPHPRPHRHPDELHVHIPPA